MRRPRSTRTPAIPANLVPYLAIVGPHEESNSCTGDVHVLGIFAKTLSGEPVKTRLRSRLGRAESERFYLASLADTLETGAVFEPHPTLFLAGGEDPGAVPELERRLFELGLAPSIWRSLNLEPQRGEDLGTRLENAFEVLLSGTPGGVLVIGSDSPATSVEMLRDAARRLSEGTSDVVLGPTADGGYWSIGVRRTHPGLLRDVAWSSPRALRDTVERAHARGLRVVRLQEWADVDTPDDLAVLSAQIAALRAASDMRTARHSECFLSELTA